MSVPARILVVDDQVENIDLIEELLEHEGFRVTSAEDGVSALAAVADEPPDCVLLDVMMPVMDGFSVCRALKSNRSTARIPVVMLTALGDVTDKVLGLNIGADDFLSKPVDPWELLARVRSLTKAGRIRCRIDEAARLLANGAAALETGPGRPDHAARVAATAVRLARSLGVPDDDLESVAHGALLHDVGEAFLPAGLREGVRAGSADAERLLRRHPELGSRLALGIPGWKDVRRIVLQHHERWNGTGYPAGRAGEDLDARTEAVAVCNRWDELLTESPTESEAVARILQEAGQGGFRVATVDGLLSNDATLPVRPGTAPPSWEDLLPPARRALRGRVLVAADRSANREILTEILSTAGHEVIVRVRAEEVLPALGEVAPDLVLIDLAGDGPDGVTVCRELRADPAGAAIPVVVATSALGPPERRRAVQAGADELLGHPVDRLELLSRVKSLLRRSVHSRDLEGLEGAVRSLGAALETWGADPALVRRLLSVAGPRPG